MNVLKQSSLLLLVMAFPLWSLAADPVGKPAAKPAINQAVAGQQRVLQHLKQELSLTDEQVKAIDKIHQDSRNQMIATRQSGPAEELKAALAFAPDSKEYDQAVQKAAEDAAVSASKRVVVMAENRKKIYAVLNPEQRKKFLAMRFASQPRQPAPSASAAKKSAEQ